MSDLENMIVEYVSDRLHDDDHVSITADGAALFSTDFETLKKATDNLYRDAVFMVYPYEDEIIFEAYPPNCDKPVFD